MARRIPIAAARKNFAEVVARSGKGERIKLTRYDRTVAVLIPKQHLENLERCEEEQARVADPARAERRPPKRR
jgi:prevent-host-death family protein